VLGPFAITYLREQSLLGAIESLAYKVDPAVFQQTFGAGIDQLNTLIASNTVTLGRLMEIAPAGTVDPTPSLYNTTMYAMAALLVIALVANMAIRRVSEKHHVENTHPEEAPAS